MANREEKRNLETIPVGSLGIISLPGCKPLGERVDQYLVKWRAERESEHKESLAFAGYQRDSYLLDAKVPRFGSGEAKGQILESVRGTDLYLLVDDGSFLAQMSLVQTGEQLGCHKSIGHFRAEVINDQQITVVDILVESGEGFLGPGVKSITRKDIK